MAICPRPSRIVGTAFILAAALITAALAPVPASADGDPASDVLLGESVFYPYSPAVSRSLQHALDAEAAAAGRAGFPIKVALIASPVDLGVIPDLFGKPQKYAEFLDQEISFRGKQPLLVVMSGGYGVQGVSGPARSAVASLAKPAGKQSNDLASAAFTAVAKLAGAAGHPIKAGPGGPSRGGARTLIVIALALAALATAGALALVTARRRRAAA